MFITKTDIHKKWNFDMFNFSFVRITSEEVYPYKSHYSHISQISVLSKAHKNERNLRIIVYFLNYLKSRMTIIKKFPICKS